MNWVNENVWSPMQPFWEQLIGFVPKLLIAFAVLLIGWFLAKLIAASLIKFFNFIRLGDLTEKLQFNKFLSDGGIRMTSMEVLHRAFYWILMFCVFLIAFQILGLDGADKILSEVVGFIPKVLIAIIVLVIGAFVARVAQGTLLVYLKNVEVGNAETVSKLAQYAIIIFAVLIALNSLNIAGFVIQWVSYAIMGIALAFGLAFGLGGKDWAAGVINRWTQKKG